MTEPRKRARTKRTANDKIKGRPLKRSGAELPPVEPAKWANAPRLKRYLKRYREPGRMICPVTGAIVEGFGPPKPVYEWREVKRGPPPMSDAEALLRIIQACQSTGERGFAQEMVDAGEARTVNAVKQRYTRVRRLMRRRAST